MQVIKRLVRSHRGSEWVDEIATTMHEWFETRDDARADHR